MIQGGVNPGKFHIQKTRAISNFSSQGYYEFLFKSTLAHCDWIHLKIDCKTRNPYNCTVKYNKNFSWKGQEMPCWINEWKDYFRTQPSSYTCVLLRLRRRTTRSFLIHFRLTLHVNVVESSNIGHCHSEPKLKIQFWNYSGKLSYLYTKYIFFGFHWYLRFRFERTSLGIKSLPI